MPCYLVVRTFEVDQAAMPDVGRRSIAIAKEEFPEIIWEHSHVIVDAGIVRQFCVYGAPDAETLRGTASASGRTASTTSGRSPATSRLPIFRPLLSARDCPRKGTVPAKRRILGRV